MILAGIAVSLVPQWSEMQQGAAVWAVMVLLLAAVPSSSAFIKIEVEFAAKRMEVLWGWFIINCWQVGLPARFERAHCTHLFRHSVSLTRCACAVCVGPAPHGVNACGRKCPAR